MVPIASDIGGTHLIPALTLETELGESEVSLVYRVNSRTARTTQRSPVLKNWRGQKAKIAD